MTTDPMPAGCKCDPRTWHCPVPLVCPERRGDSPLCDNCEHEEACHSQGGALELETGVKVPGKFTPEQMDSILEFAAGLQRKRLLRG